MRENMSNEVKGFIREVLDRMVAPLLAAAEKGATVQPAAKKS